MSGLRPWTPVAAASLSVLAFACGDPAEEPAAPPDNQPPVACFSDVTVAGVALDPAYTEAAVETRAVVALGAESVAVTLSGVQGTPTLDGIPWARSGTD